MEERPALWRVAANMVHKQSRTPDEGWFPSMGVGRVSENSSPYKRILWLNNENHKEHINSGWHKSHVTLQAVCQNIECPMSFAPPCTCILCNYNSRFLSLSLAVNVENTGLTGVKSAGIFSDEFWKVLEGPLSPLLQKFRLVV
jgi:hypothetical protein